MKNLLFVAIIFIAVNSYSQSPDFQNIIGTKFPQFELTSLSGEKINSSSLKGKVVFINLWFTACVPCIEEMPELNKLQELYGEKVDFYAITFDDEEKVRRFLQKRDFYFDHIVGADSFLKSTLGIKSYPTNIIIDREGQIQYVNNGIPFTKDEKTGEMVMLSYKFFEGPLKKVLGI